MLDNQTVLRLTKEPINTTDKHLSSSDLEELFKLVEYSQGVLKPLLGSKFVPKMEVITLSRENAQLINDVVYSERPEFRKLKRVKINNCVGLSLPDCARIDVTTSTAPLSCRHHGTDAAAMGNLVDAVDAVDCVTAPLDEVSPVRVDCTTVVDQGRVIAVEIKPKMGFHPLSSSNVLRKVCKYQLMQRKKLKEGRISTISKYCPLDLFSGCRERMTRAIEGLLKDPQNNFALFMNGHVVYGGNSPPSTNFGEILKNFFAPSTGRIAAENDGFEESLEGSIGESTTLTTNFCHLVMEALLTVRDDSKAVNDDNGGDYDDSLNPPKTVCCCRCSTGGVEVAALADDFGGVDLEQSKNGVTSCSNKDDDDVDDDDDDDDDCAGLLPKDKNWFSQSSLNDGCVLKRILNVQQKWPMDVERIRPYYDKLVAAMNNIGSTLFNEYRLEEVLYGSGKEELQNINCELKEAVLKVRDFLMSATLKDCSIMISMKELNERDNVNTIDTIEQKGLNVITDANGVKRYVVSVRILDLDSKPWTRIEKYLKEEKELVRIWKEYSKD